MPRRRTLPPTVDGSIFLVDELGWLRIGIVVAITILGLYFNNLYADVRMEAAPGFCSSFVSSRALCFLLRR